MSLSTWSKLLVTPILLGVSTLIAASASAQTAADPAPAKAPASVMSIETPATPAVLQSQVTSVSQLSDVRPTDWAFQALQSLVERYGCIVGYPDKTFRGNRATTRFEFAAGLNACLDRVNELIAASTADLVKKEDLATLQRLQEEFAAELATIRGQVDALEARTTTLEKQQFSTTTKLNAEVIFAISGVQGGDRALNSDQQRQVDNPAPLTANQRRDQLLPGGRGVRDNTIFTDRVRLNLDTSFSGKDRLRTRLQARNTTSFNTAITGTEMTRLGFDGDQGNAIELSRLEYRFPLGNLTTVFIGTGTNDGLEYNDIVPTLNPLESSANGSISRFGRFNPIYRAGTGTGLVVNHKFGSEFTFGSKFNLSLGYLVPTGVASNPIDGNGLFNGNFAALGQLVFQPTPALSLGLTYTRGYYRGGAGVTGGTGSAFANNPFNSARTTANAYGLEATFRLTPGFIISGWGGYTRAQAERGSGGINPLVNQGDEAEIWNWAATLAFPDFLKEGNLAGIVVGMPPRAGRSDYGVANPGVTGVRRRDSDRSLHVEGFYRYRLNDNISITPGLLVILNPEHNNDNDTEYVGTIRTTFAF
ncbi:MAG: iron uptake porin [Phormidesmis sp. CAN_BIN44]|nr:iron uptake porin [Phormidesmis sp. CAN_BIN44]